MKFEGWLLLDASNLPALAHQILFQDINPLIRRLLRKRRGQLIELIYRGFYLILPQLFLNAIINWIC